MIVDKNNELSLNQAFTDTSGASTNEIQAGANAGKGKTKTFVFTVTTAFTTGSGTPTLVVSLQSATAAGGSYADVVALPARGVAALTAGTQFSLVLPTTHSAYVRAYYTVAGGAFGAGKISCHEVLDQQTNRSW